MSIMFSTMSPDDPSWQASFNQASNRYLTESAVGFACGAALIAYLTILARKTRSAKKKKQLLLARKVILYVGIIGWVVFTGIIYGIIPTT